MSDLAYSIEEWRESYKQAEIENFRNEGQLADWPLSRFMCETVKAVDKEPLVMAGAIDMLESEGFQEFSTEFFTTVLSTAHGETTDDFQELVTEWVRENMAPLESGIPDPDQMNGPDDWELWFLSNSVKPGEVYGGIPEGGTLFWFNRGDVW